MVVIFYIFVNTTSNFEIRRMLYHVDFIIVSRKCKVVTFVFEMQLWRRFPLKEFSIKIDHFILKQIIFPKRRFRLETNTFQADKMSLSQIKLKSDQNITYWRKYGIFALRDSLWIDWTCRKVTNHVFVFSKRKRIIETLKRKYEKGGYTMQHNNYVFALLNIYLLNLS
jgi:hypothetical protein